MKPDTDIKRDVEAELKWNPQIDEKDIAVKVNGGVVALSGYARNYTEKCLAEETVKRVAGVAAVANDIMVRLGETEKATDPEIARAALAALKSELASYSENIKVLVDNGHVRLEGKVGWHFQRERAEAAVRRVKGVATLGNHIGIVPMAAPGDIKHRIEEAFRRSAEVDAAHVAVDADGTEITLRGEVRTWAEREQAQQCAWSAPGVTKVTNNLRVTP